MNAPVIEVKGLTKRDRGRTVVDGVDLAVIEGEILGLFGPAGSGKTVILLMLLGLANADGGSARVLGLDPQSQPLQVRRSVGYLPEAVGFCDNLSARENLRHTARLGGLSGTEVEERIDRALHRVSLSDVGDRRVSTFSHGMRQRLGLAELIMRDVRILVLDEPTSGLDPRSTAEMLHLIRSLAVSGMTVLVASRLLDTVQPICSRVALLSNGKIGFTGRVAELRHLVSDGGFRVDVEAEGIDAGTIALDVDGVFAADAAGAGRWRVTANRDPRPELARRIVAGGGELRGMSLRNMSLADAYSRYFSGERHEA